MQCINNCVKAEKADVNSAMQTAMRKSEANSLMVHTKYWLEKAESLVKKAH